MSIEKKVDEIPRRPVEPEPNVVPEAGSPLSRRAVLFAEPPEGRWLPARALLLLRTSRDRSVRGHIPRPHPGRGAQINEGCRPVDLAATICRSLSPMGRHCPGRSWTG